LQTILIGTTLSGVVSASFITEMCGQLFGPRGLGIATVSVSLIQLTAGEIIPKLLAVSSPVMFCSATLPIFYRISAVVYPVSRFLNKAVSLMLHCFGISVDTSKTPLVSEAELDLMFNSAMKSGVLDGEEGDMIRSVRNLDRKSVKEVMTPLIDMICIDAQQSLDRLHQLWRETQFSRVPVYSNRFDKIVGVVSMKSLLKHVRLFDSGADARGVDMVESICDTPFFVPETMSLLSALRQLKERTIAICVDEYGGTTGLVTLEDALEEIVGEIYDPEEEKDKLERVQNSSKIKELGKNRWDICAVAAIEDVNDVLGVELPSGDYNSIGGFVCMHIDRIPEEGEAVLVETATKNVRFEVSGVDDRRVLQIEAFIEEEEDESDDGRRSSVATSVEDEEERDRVLDVRMETEEDQEGAAEDSGSAAQREGK
jgi:CBS domain containing-hemolysin-like protein